MSEKDIDLLSSKTENKFLLANAAAGRAKQIVEGSLPYVNNFDPHNPVITALREIAADKIKIKILSAPKIDPNKLLKRKVEEEAPSALDRLSKDAKRKKEKK